MDFEATSAAAASGEAAAAAARRGGGRRRPAAASGGAGGALGAARVRGGGWASGWLPPAYKALGGPESRSDTARRSVRFFNNYAQKKNKKKY